MLLSPRQNGLTRLFKEVRVFKETVPAVPVPLSVSQWARRDRLMSRGKNCRETIFVFHLSRNYPHRGVNFERGKKTSRVGETVWEAF